MTAETKPEYTEGTDDKVEIDEVEAILPTPGHYSIPDGENDAIPVNVRRLKTREILTLMNIITRGIGPGLSQAEFSDDPDEIGSQVLALFLMAAPNALTEVMAFLVLITEAVDDEETARLRAVLRNPPLDVTIDIISIVIQQEQGDFQALLGKLRLALAAGSRVQKKTPQKSPTRRRK